MTPMTEIYKVCRVTDDGTLRSAVVYGTDASRHGLDLEYPLNEEVHAPEGTAGIFCFPELERATNFMDSHPYTTKVVVRCITTHTPKPLGYVYGTGLMPWWRGRTKQLLRYQHADMFGTPRVYVAPPCTCVVPSLTPVEVMT